MTITNSGVHDMYDVIVVGAGPSGSTCARICAKKGLKTVLLDKDTFPRSKPCAGAVSMQALSWLDVPLPEEIIEKECFGARIHYNGRSIDVRKKERIAVLVSRNDFDRFLADKAVESGAVFLPGEKVIHVSETRDSVTVRTETNSFEARFLVGADGVHSLMANSVRPPFRKDELALAVVCQIRADDDEIDERLQHTIAIHFGIAPLGYGWLFPHRGYYSLGTAGLASAFSNPRKTLTAYAQTLQIAPEAVRGHFIPLGGIKRRIAANRILLAGDAAGFADPFHGEGISHAIVSGRLAADAVIGSFEKRGGPGAAVLQYSNECERHIRKHLRVALYMARLLDRFPKLFVRIFLDNKTALEQYLEIPSGRSDYRRFLRWLSVRIPFYLLSSFLKDIRGTRPGDENLQISIDR